MVLQSNFKLILNIKLNNNISNVVYSEDTLKIYFTRIHRSLFKKKCTKNTMIVDYKIKHTMILYLWTQKYHVY